MFENCDYLGDWPSCLHFMKDLDEICRCPICFDFMQAPMLLPNCDHNFCSLCIRQFFVHKEHCPVCFRPASSNVLRNNQLLERAILQLRKIRMFLLDLTQKNKSLDKTLYVTSRSHETTILAEDCDAQHTALELDSTIYSEGDAPKVSGYIEVPAKRNSQNVDHEILIAGEQHNHSLATSGALCDGDSDIEIITDSSEIFSNFKKNKALAGVSPRPKTVQSKLFSHLKMPTDVGKLTAVSVEKSSPVWKNQEGKRPLKDHSRSLIQRGSPSLKSSTIRDGDSSLNTQPANKVPCPVCGIPVLSRAINNHLDICLAAGDKKQTLRLHEEKKKHMPKLVYSIMSDKEIRRRLRELGLSAEGDRQVLIKRHHDFTLLYNSNCDALVSKDISALKKEFEEQHQVQKKLALKDSSPGQMMLRFPKNPNQMDIEKAQKLYARQHKKQFKFLIEQTKSAMAAARTMKDGSHSLRSGLAEMDVVDETGSWLEERNVLDPNGNDLKQKRTESSGDSSSEVASDLREACWEKVLEDATGSRDFAQTSGLELEWVDAEEHLSEESKSCAHGESGLHETFVDETLDDDNKTEAESNLTSDACCHLVRQLRKCSDVAAQRGSPSLDNLMTPGVPCGESAESSEIVQNEYLDRSPQKLKDRSFTHGNGSRISASLSRASSPDISKQFCLGDNSAAEWGNSDIPGKLEVGNLSTQFNTKTSFTELKTSCKNSSLEQKFEINCSSIPIFKKSVRFSVSEAEKYDEGFAGIGSSTGFLGSQQKSLSREFKLFSPPKLSFQSDAVPSSSPREENAVPSSSPREENAVPSISPREENGVPSSSPREENGVPSSSPREENGVPSSSPREENGVPSSSPQEESVCLAHEVTQQAFLSVVNTPVEDGRTNNQPTPSTILRNLRKKRSRKNSESKICDGKYSANVLPLEDEDSTSEKKSKQEETSSPEGGNGLRCVSKMAEGCGRQRKRAKRRKSVEAGAGKVFCDVTSKGESPLRNRLPERCLQDTGEKDCESQSPVRSVRYALRAKKCSDGEHIK